MKTPRVLFLTLVLVSAFAGAAMAQDGERRIEHREWRQDARIHQGVRSGELTRGEAMRLRMGERHIDRMVSRAECRGPLNGRERARIDRAQNRESRRIWRLKHNAIER